MELSRAKAVEVLGEAIELARPKVEAMQVVALLTGRPAVGRAAEECMTAMEMGVAALREADKPVRTDHEQVESDRLHAGLMQILREGIASNTPLCVQVLGEHRDLVLKAFDRAIAVLQGE